MKDGEKEVMSIFDAENKSNTKHSNEMNEINENEIYYDLQLLNNSSIRSNTTVRASQHKTNRSRTYNMKLFAPLSIPQNHNRGSPQSDAPMRSITDSIFRSAKRTKVIPLNATNSDRSLTSINSHTSTSYQHHHLNRNINIHHHHHISHIHPPRQTVQTVYPDPDSPPAPIYASSIYVHHGTNLSPSMLVLP
eukprot:346703_1